LNSKPGVRIWP